VNNAKNQSTTEAVQQILESNGADLFGFADITSLAADVRHDFPYAIAFALSLNPELVAAIPSGASLEYIEEVDDVSARLDNIGRHVADYLTSHGFRAMTFEATIDDDSYGVLSTPFPHKTVAVLAGIGWIGKCALVVNKKYGSAIRINKVLTDAPLTSVVPDLSVKCGTCVDCVDVCPGNALTGKNWSLGLPLEAYYDVHACNHAASERCEKTTGVDDAYCGLCINACPWTQKYLKKVLSE
jgi:epoxyqueuosine reductase QueG